MCSEDPGNEAALGSVFLALLLQEVSVAKRAGPASVRPFLLPPRPGGAPWANDLSAPVFTRFSHMGDSPKTLPASPARPLSLFPDTPLLPVGVGGGERG